VTLRTRSALGIEYGAAAPAPSFAAGLLPSDRFVLRDRTDLGCILVNSAVDAREIIGPLATALEIAFPLEPGEVLGESDLRSIWLTPRSWLLRCPLTQEIGLVAKVCSIFADKSVHASMFTDAVCWLEWSGTGSQSVLSEGGFVSLESDGLPAGHAKRTVLAGVAVVVERLRAETWLLGVERSRACYLAAWLTAAAVRAEALGRR
jgi:heterotetrameric sarcosine oxidase gamma subunit